MGINGESPALSRGCDPSRAFGNIPVSQVCALALCLLARLIEECGLGPGLRRLLSSMAYLNELVSQKRHSVPPTQEHLLGPTSS